MTNKQASLAARQIHFHPLDPHELERQYPEVHEGLHSVVSKQLRRIWRRTLGMRGSMYGCVP